MARVEHAADLHIDGIAKLALDRGRQKRRQALGNGRNTEPGDQKQRCGGADTPGDHAQALAALQRAGAVDQGGARVDFGGKGLIGNFQSFQNRAVNASKAEKVIRRRQFLQLVIRPLAKCAAIMAGDLKGSRFENDEHLMPRAGHAVEINAGAGCHGSVHQ